MLLIERLAEDLAQLGIYRLRVIIPQEPERGIDLLTPVYNMLDLTPQGRGNWYASLQYPGE